MSTQVPQHLLDNLDKAQAVKERRDKKAREKNRRRLEILLREEEEEKYQQAQQQPPLPLPPSTTTMAQPHPIVYGTPQPVQPTSHISYAPTPSQPAFHPSVLPPPPQPFNPLEEVNRRVAADKSHRRKRKRRRDDYDSDDDDGDSYDEYGSKRRRRGRGILSTLLTGELGKSVAYTVVGTLLLGISNYYMERQAALRKNQAAVPTPTAPARATGSGVRPVSSPTAGKSKQQPAVAPRDTADTKSSSFRVQRSSLGKFGR